MAGQKLKRMFSVKSVYNKIIFGFLSVALPLYVIGILIIWNVSGSILEEARKSMEDKLLFFTGYIEDELSNINQMLVALNLNEELDTFYSLKEERSYFDSFKTFNALMKRLKSIHLSSDYISDVFLLSTQTREEISVNWGYRGVTDNRSAILDFYSGEEAIVRLNSYIDGDYIVYFIRNNSEYILGVEIFQRKIIESVKKYQLNYNFQAFLTDARTGRLIGGDALTELDKAVFQKVREEGLTTDGSLVIGKDKYIVQSLVSKDKNFEIITYTLERELLSNYYTLLNMALLFFILSLSILAFISFLIDKQVKKPLNVLVRHMREVELGNYDVSLSYKKDDEFGFVYQQFNNMSGKLKTLISEVLEKKIQLQQSELKQLQSHINPHFLFNCLYIGYRMAKAGDHENVALLCKYLGDYFRFITYFSCGEVSLKDELHYTHTYLNIQKFRYGDRLSFTLNCEVDPEKIIVPGLMLQPLVENAIQHGVERMARPGFVEVHIRKAGSELSVTVADNGPGMTWEEIERLRENLKDAAFSEKHYGLWSIQRRISYLYDTSNGLEITSREGGGLKVAYSIPCKEEA